MNNSVLLTFSLLSAITLAMVYRPIFAKLSVGLVSPYAKADVMKRFLAATLDGILVAAMLVAGALVPNRGWGLVYVVAGVAYVLSRDAVLGRSLGKFACGLVVINLETGRPCGWNSSVRRNVLFVLPGANVVAAFLETGTSMRDPQGQRLGDRFALTQVIEGFGAKDVVAAAQEWWLNFTANLDRYSHGPER